MKRKYTIGLDGSGAAEMLEGVLEYKAWLKRKSAELSERLARIGATSASLGFARAIYTNNDGSNWNDHAIRVEQRGENQWAVIADGEDVLFVEFGSGVKYGYGHPEAVEHGMGPGTYPIPPGKGHWDDPRGWWTPGRHHTYGNPPNMPMYNSVKELEQDLENIVREVFAS